MADGDWGKGGGGGKGGGWDSGGWEDGGGKGGGKDATKPGDAPPGYTVTTGDAGAPGEDFNWENGLVGGWCGGHPGGAGLAAFTFCCPCATMGDVNSAAGGPGGWAAGCIGTFTVVLAVGLLANAGVRTAARGGFPEKEGWGLAIGKAIACTMCYMVQIHNECRLQKTGQVHVDWNADKKTEDQALNPPGQQYMGDQGASAAPGPAGGKGQW